MRTNTNYRNIWEKHHECKIPKGWDIHHRDGNQHNNDISNLTCLTREEHIHIHWNQRDYAAAHLLTKNGLVGWKHSDSTKEKMRIAHTGDRHYQWGKPLSDEFKQKLSECHADFSGENHPMWNKTHSDETKIKMSESARNRDPSTRIGNVVNQTCEHCGITTTCMLIGRWHGDNCKEKS